eukprot:scaffold18739_cov149-Skeletonema_dohrnii-CCMP3373.AAC.1
MPSDDDDDAQTQDKLTQAQLTAIENEIKSSQPLTSQLLPISALLHQYSTTAANEQQQSAGFIQSAQFLSTKYTSLRRVRGDGNCYYRAFLYSLCEHLLLRNSNNNETGGSKEFSRIKTTIANSLKWVCQFGYEEMTIDMFYEELVELFDFISAADNNDKSASTAAGATKNESNRNNAQQQLHSKLNEENSTSDYCTWYLRVLTAAQMKSNPDRFLPFLLADETNMMMDIPTFCSREVEPMGKECGMVTVAALAECLGVKVVIEYMDGRLSNNDAAAGGIGIGSSGEVVNHVFGQIHDEDDEDRDRICLTLLYRPGHYDILY